MNPPSIVRFAPVIYRAFSEVRNAIASAISSGVPSVPKGMRLSSFAIWFCGIFFRVNLVFMNPGDIELTLIPVGPSSTASVFAAPSSACFERL